MPWSAWLVATPALQCHAAACLLAACPTQAGAEACPPRTRLARLPSSRPQSSNLASVGAGSSRLARRVTKKPRQPCARTRASAWAVGRWVGRWVLGKRKAHVRLPSAGQRASCCQHSTRSVLPHHIWPRKPYLVQRALAAHRQLLQPAPASRVAGGSRQQRVEGLHGISGGRQESFACLLEGFGGRARALQVGQAVVALLHCGARPCIRHGAGGGGGEGSSGGVSGACSLHGPAPSLPGCRVLPGAAQRVQPCLEAARALNCNPARQTAGLQAATRCAQVAGTLPDPRTGAASGAGTRWLPETPAVRAAGWDLSPTSPASFRAPVVTAARGHLGGHLAGAASPRPHPEQYADVVRRLSGGFQAGGGQRE